MSIAILWLNIMLSGGIFVRYLKDKAVHALEISAFLSEIFGSIFLVELV